MQTGKQQKWLHPLLNVEVENQAKLGRLSKLTPLYVSLLLKERIKFLRYFLIINLILTFKFFLIFRRLDSALCSWNNHTAEVLGFSSTSESPGSFKLLPPRPLPWSLRFSWPGVWPGIFNSSQHDSNVQTR